MNMEKHEKQKEVVALSSVFASFLLTIFKLVVGILTGSMGIISEAAHSALDLGAAAITYSAVKASKKPADVEHHYGHGKVESLSALAETILLFVTSAWIIYEAVHRLISTNVEVEVAWYSFLVMIISIIVDLSRSKALSKVAKETNSQALEADALHFQSDIYSSAVVILGLIFVSFGVKGADSIAAIGVAILVVFVSYRLGKRTIDVLLDTAPKEITENVKKTVLNVGGIVSIERLRLRPAGESYFVDMVVGVSRKIPLEMVNKITKNIEDEVCKIIPRADVTVHVKPIILKDETIVEQIKIIADNLSLSIHDINVQDFKNKKIINFDLEVDNNLSLAGAHKKATDLENEIKKELGEDLEINTHIEPTAPPASSGNVTKKEMDHIQKILKDIKRQIKFIKDFHDVSARKVKGNIFISLHCSLDNNVKIEEAHALTNKIEYLIKKHFPNVERTVVHTEPLEEN